jgi:ATP-dependent Clp protease adapter protein ClpS
MRSHSVYHRIACEYPFTNDKKETEMWELGLLVNSNPALPLDYTSRCINEVIGISEDDSLEAATLAYRHGVALLEECPLDIAVSLKVELGRRGILCEIVPVDEEAKNSNMASHYTLEDTADTWDLGLLQDGRTNRREYTARCLCQVIQGLSEADAYEAIGQADNCGVTLIGEFHSELAEHYAAELSKLDIAVCACG